MFNLLRCLCELEEGWFSLLYSDWLESMPEQPIRMLHYGDLTFSRNLVTWSLSKFQISRKPKIDFVHVLSFIYCYQTVVHLGILRLKQYIFYDMLFTYLSGCWRDILSNIYYISKMPHNLVTVSYISNMNSVLSL